MRLLTPDILAEARGLSVTIPGIVFVLGLLIWLLGWRGHRFWIVLAMTVSAGMVGLSWGQGLGTRPLLAGLLLAVTAGVMALALVRMVVFAAGGVAGWLLVRMVFPAWEEPLVCLLAGGLIGILLFRVWTMALTSGIGTVLMAYSSLCLADSVGKVDAVCLAEEQATVLNLACAGVAVLGFLIQFFLDRRRGREGPRRASRPRGGPFREEGSRSWFDGIQFYRRAG
jgi:hypothetical protein